MLQCEDVQGQVRSKETTNRFLAKNLIWTAKSCGALKLHRRSLCVSNIGFDLPFPI